MLSIFGRSSASNCDGSSRRDFLKIGTLGLSSIGLSHLLQSRALASAAGQSTRSASVVWLWLGGGASHVETFDPKPAAPAEYRSVTGAIKTNVPGVEIGGSFPLL